MAAGPANRHTMRHDFIRRGGALLAALLLICAPGLANEVRQHIVTHPAAIVGAPSSVYDGDTLTIHGQAIRLWGIDAPELDTPAGPASRDALRAIIGRQELGCVPVLELHPDLRRSVGCQNRARSYHRVVARCFDATGRDIAAALVLAGWATDWPRFSCRLYAPLEADAIAHGRGMWAD